MNTCIFIDWKFFLGMFVNMINVLCQNKCHNFQLSCFEMNFTYIFNKNIL